ncbi:MAG: DUF2442 domain-containing protein [Eubacteriales bacterium]|nr:DUF2442 domain-containing protein [Eubacteriales bacterium]
MFPKVVQVVPTKEYSVYVYFEDGKIVCYDMSQMLEKEVFQPLKDIDIFVETCTVLNDTLAWDIDKNRDNTTCLDIDPFVLYALPMAEERIA